MEHDQTHDETFDVSHFLPYLLNQTAEQTSRAFQDVYRSRYGMLRTEWRVLFHLGQYGALRATEISTRAMIDKVKISRAVKALEEKRFLVRKPHDSDGRVELLVLTREGETAFKDLWQEAARYEQHLSETLSKAELKQLKGLLLKLLSQS